MRKVVLNIAMSLDGFIAREDGTYDWIEGHGTDAYDSANQFDNPSFFASCDTVIMGRKSFEDCPIELIEGYREKTFYVASSQVMTSPYSNVYFSKDIVSTLKQLKAGEGGPIWIFGGADLVHSLIEADLIDHYIIGIIPTILGCGRPLFTGNRQERHLRLIESTVTDGIAMLRYDKRG
ncbi:dihydrofolate reductase family protein [Streptococcus dysgalactiae subsp. equisimilis]|uniref:Riboflavin biosynthesis protein RibD C-domain protein n=2 Tax=Streptococcus dysgalactiae TaxID=1334 RepID=A0AB33R6B9_STREQ|nr:MULTISPECIES: dihydrofolate reductase family protein [Streptococcus]EGL48824.1 riboflavin biosynthesis protein RibD C-terminal domain protein [Streptococcus dysgalactiae subsp. equisimilis SK1249]KKC18799.1 diadenosine tetraphosphate hydrolase [Streptococcus dysgalactiae subsp. equisimilis]MBM6540249.1 dihydrofolate reductase [Streptococcus dysgalactiae subsp. equisimilis]MCY7196204.1 dihydrofolate reductase family protein [Streptococcus dysgalactiae]MCY7199722.1 dihydrofolate reductase fam